MFQRKQTASAEIQTQAIFSGLHYAAAKLVNLIKYVVN